MTASAQTKRFRETLIAEAPAYDVALTAEALDGLSHYHELLRLWNARLHLVAPCSPAEFATRHVLESLVLLKHLPNNSHVADIGSGGGLPIIPCLIAGTDLRAVLIEATQKKAVFLREALAQTGLSAKASIVNERFENVIAPAVDFVTCRALERFEEMLPQLFAWAPANATLLLFGGERLAAKVAGLSFSATSELMPHSHGRYLFVVQNRER